MAKTPKQKFEGTRIEKYVLRKKREGTTKLARFVISDVIQGSPLETNTHRENTKSLLQELSSDSSQGRVVGTNKRFINKTSSFYERVAGLIYKFAKLTKEMTNVRSYGLVLDALALSLTSVRFVVSIFVLSVVLVAAVLPQPTSAAINEQLNFQARLLTNGGSLVADGNYHVRYKIYEDGDGDLGGGDETLAWTEERTTGNLVRVVNGYMSVQLGDVTAFGSSVDWGNDTLWLSIEIGGSAGSASWDGELDPFMRLTSTPYAFNANNLDGLDSTDFVQIAQGEQAVNSASTLLAIDQTGAGDLIDLQVSNSTVFSVSNAGNTVVGGTLQAGATTFTSTLDVQGASVTIGQASTTDGTLIFENNTNAFTTTLAVTDATADRTITFPDATGTVLLDSTLGTTAFIQNGNSFGANAVLGTNDTYSLSFETDGTTALTIDTSQDVSLVGNLTVAATKTINLTGGTTAQRPGSPTEGMIYFDSDTDSLLTYANGKWQSDRGEYIVVAANDSTQAEKDSADYVADGTADESEINSALAALPAGGGTVYLLEGTYVVSGTVNLVDNATLAGSGMGTIITLVNSHDANISLITLDGDTNVVIRDLAIDGNRTGQSAGFIDGIILNNSSHRFTATNLSMYDHNSEGINITSGDNATVSHIRFLADTSNGVAIRTESPYGTFSNLWVDSHSRGFYSRAGSTNTILRDSIFISSSASAIDVSASNTQVLNNIVSGGSSYGVLTDTLTDVIISGNTFDTTGTDSINTGGTRIIVSDNHVVDSGGHGLSLYGTDVLVGDNIVENAASDGIRLVDYSGVNRTVSGNTISSSGAAGMNLGGDDFIVTSNRIIDSGSYGIVADGNSYVIDGNVVENSGTATASRSGIAIGGNSYKIVNNTITDTAGTGDAIDLSYGSNNYFANNTYSGTGAETINDSGTNTIYANQLNAAIDDSAANIQLQAPNRIQLDSSTVLSASATTVLTGTIDPAASTTVPGVGTLFLTELEVGDRITVTGETRTVTAIASDISLTVDTAFSDNANDTAPDRLPATLIVKDSAGNVDFLIKDDGTVQLSNLDCTGNDNGGALTVDSEGNISCSDDDDSGATLTLQGTYDNDADGSDSIIALTTADDGIIFRNPASGGSDSTYVLTVDQLATGTEGGVYISSAGTGNLLTVRDATATAVDVFTIADTGKTTFKPQTDDDDVFRVRNAADDNSVLIVDTTNSRVGIGLYNTVPSLSGRGLQVDGAIKISGTDHTDFLTPGAATVSARFTSVMTPGGIGAFKQVIAVGLDTGSATTSRAISVFDGRVAGDNQPAIALFSPDELNILGFSFDGSNTQGSIKATGTTDIGFKSGTNTYALFDGADGSFLLQNFTDTTTGFQVLDADGGTPIFNVDTTNERVGIGTAAPQSLLEIEGDALADVRIQSTGANSVARLYLQNDAQTWNVAVNTADNFQIADSGNNIFVIQNGGTSEALRIDNDGNVGIGTSSPLTVLDVAGSGRFIGSATSVLTGSIDPAASTTVTGVGTAFLTELVIGDRITVTGETRTVTAIASDTSLTVDTAFSNNANDTSPDKLPAILTVLGNGDPDPVFSINDNGDVVFQPILGNGSSFTINNDSGGQIFGIDSTGGTRRVFVGSGACETGGGILCVNQSDTGAGGGVINMQNLININTTSGGNQIAQRIVVKDTSAAIANEVKGLTVEIDAFTTNDSATITGIEVTGRSENAGYLIDLQSDGSSAFSVNNTGAAVFQNQADSTTGFQVLDADGGTPVFNVDTINERVGIGTATPTNALDISQSGNGARASIRLEVSGSGSDQDATIIFADTGEGDYWSLGADDTSDRFVLANSTELGSSTRLVVDTDGKVGIGVDVPSSALDVVGAAADGSFVLEVENSTTDGDLIVARNDNSNRIFEVGTSSGGEPYLVVSSDDQSSEAVLRIDTLTGLARFELASTGGTELLRLSTDDELNVFLGYQAGIANDQTGGGNNGLYNTFVGGSAGVSNTTGFANLFFGSHAGSVNTTGDRNTALGGSALRWITLGNNNTAIGDSALSGTSGLSTSAEDNVAIGYQAGEDITDGDQNIFIGVRAGQGVTSGINNVIIGYQVAAVDPAGNDQLNIMDILESSDVRSGDLIVNGNDAADTPSLTIGTTDQDGSLRLADGTTNYVTFATEALGGNYTISVPTEIAANDTLCLESLGNCDGSGGLQGAYNFGNTIVATDANGDIDLTVSEATNFSVDITGTGSFLVQDGGTAVLSVVDGGAATFQNVTDTTSGFQVLDADGGTSIFNVDTTNERVGIGIDAPTAKLQVIGSSNDESTSSLLVQNNSGTDLLKVQDSGRISIGIDTAGGGGVLGKADVGNNTDSGNSNTMEFSQFTTDASGLTANYATVYIDGPVDPSSNDNFTMAIYTDSSGDPDTKVAESAEGTVVADSWVTVTISASLSPSTTYWIGYNSNQGGAYDETLRSDSAASNASCWQGQTYGTWPGTFSGTCTNQPDVFSMYVSNASSGTSAITITDQGLVGIGDASPGAKLDIKSNVSTDVALIVQGAASQTGDMLQILNSGGDELLQIQDDGTTIFQVDTDSTTGFQILDANGGTSVFNVDTTNERVGIGTDAPDAQLEVVATSNAAIAITRDDNTVLDGESFGAYTFRTTDTDVVSNPIVAQITAQAAADYTADAAPSDLLFKIQNQNGSQATPLSVVSNATYAGGAGIQIAQSQTAFATLAVSDSGNLNDDLQLDVADGTNNAYFVFTAEGNLGINGANANRVPTASLEILLNGTTDLLQLSSSVSDDGDIFVVTDTGEVGIGVEAPTADLEFGESSNRTLGIEARASNAAGRTLTVSAGAAGAGASAFAGGDLILQGGDAAGTGNADGGNVTLTGGAGTGTGTQGLIVIENLTLATSTTQSCGSNCTITQADVDATGAVIVDATAAALEVTLPDPSIATAGRVVYVTAANGSNDFTLVVNGGGQGNEIAMRADTTATMIWNGADWTAAGASSSTTLQAAYDNTLTSAGGAEIVLSAPGGNADGFTIRNNDTSPIDGGILEVQSSIGTNLFSVNNLGTELAANGGAETSTTFATDWASIGSSTVSRTTTSGEYVTGQAGAKVITTGVASDGIRNNLTSNPTVSTTHQVSFTAKLSSGTFSTLEVLYSRDGGTDEEVCTTYSSQTLVTTGWTKITCTITTDGTTATDPDLIIRQTDANARTFWVDNLSFQQNDASTEPSNVQIGGGIDGGPITLFTLDRSSSPPVADGNDTFLGSMYYDTVTGRIQCYESDGWGACGSPPNNIITLTPEYAGSVLNGTGIGTMTADFCSNESGVLAINSTLCDSGEAVNYYEWTSPQATDQTYSIYLTFQLPDTFKEFINNNTITLDARTTDTTDASVAYEVYRSTGSAITECGSSTTVTSSNDTWQTVAHSGDENDSCSFAGGDRVIFKLIMTAKNNDSVYVSDINFTYTNE